MSQELITEIRDCLRERGRIPRRAGCVERLYGITGDGDVLVCKVFTHTRAGHTLPGFYVLQYVERDRAIDCSTRVIQQFTGYSGRVRLGREMAETRDLLAGSRVRAAAMVGAS